MHTATMCKRPLLGPNTTVDRDAADATGSSIHFGRSLCCVSMLVLAAAAVPALCLVQHRIDPLDEK